MADTEQNIPQATDSTGGDERRRAPDRRVIPVNDRRGPRPSPWVRKARVLGRDALIVAGAVGAIVASVRFTKPILMNQPTVVEGLTRSAAPIAPIAKAILGANDTLNVVTSSPEFQRDRVAFAADLVATGRVAPARADSIAYYAVREAYVRKIPPAVIFGVMLTENAKFISGAMSDVGAIGLMQVYPKVWLKPLSALFGKPVVREDLGIDSTNIKAGVYILSEYIKTTQGGVNAAVVNKGLLRYNGCVRGAHTKNCKTYPSKVGKYVERQANAICGTKTFYVCIAKPFIAGLKGKEAAPAP
jgi:hypothetical protein